MHITDPIADMLTRIRNANNAKHDTVDVPASNMKKSIAQILLDEGYIKNFQLIDDGTQGVIRITLKYGAGKEKVISGGGPSGADPRSGQPHRRADRKHDGRGFSTAGGLLHCYASERQTDVPGKRNDLG